MKDGRNQRRSSRARGDLVKRTARIDATLQRVFGDPPGLAPADPLETLVLTLLSQNTNDKNRDRAYASLRETFPTWQDAAAASAGRVARAIRSGGLAEQKAERILALLRWARKRFGGFDLSPLADMNEAQVLEELEGLKGMGPKTVSILLLFSLGMEAFPVDTHCLRVLTRLQVLAEGTTAKKAHEIMRDLVPTGRSYPLHIHLIRFGRERCHARKPRCTGCPFLRSCGLEPKNMQG